MSLPPERFEPGPESLRDKAEKAAVLTGSSISMAIVHYLSKRDRALLVEIRDDLERDHFRAGAEQYSQTSTSRQLVALEEIGVVEVDLPQGMRRGRTCRYNVNHDRVRELFAAQFEFMTGEQLSDGAGQ